MEIGGIITIFNPDSETTKIFLEIFGRFAMRWEVQLVKENYGETSYNLIPPQLKDKEI